MQPSFEYWCAEGHEERLGLRWVLRLSVNGQHHGAGRGRGAVGHRAGGGGVVHPERELWAAGYG